MYLTRTRNFGNAREVRNAMDRAIKNQGVRLLELKGTPDYDASMVHVLTRADIEGEESKNIKSLDVVLAELNEFVGMDSVKAEIRALANKIAMDKEMMEMGIADAEVTPVHIVLTGNRGQVRPPSPVSWERSLKPSVCCLPIKSWKRSVNI